MFPNRLKTSRMNMNLSLEEVAERYNKKFNGGLNKGTLSKYENGKQIPLSNIISNLAEILGVSTDYLFGKTDWKTLEARNDKWEEWNKIHNIDNKITTENEYFEKILSKIPLYNIPVSAGSGQWLAEGNDYEFAYLENVPVDADFALIVRGDSMEPVYVDNDIIFVKTNVIVESGQTGIFYLNGNGYLKTLQGDKLISINKQYEPIIIKDFDSFFCIGRIIGKTTYNGSR